MDSALLPIVLLLTAAVVAVFVARVYGVPGILAYLVTGIALGPHGAGVLPDRAAVEQFAEFGVVFLMFSIGLEFNLTRLNAMRALVLGFGGAQFLLTAGAVTGISIWAYDLRWQSGLAVGLAIAMSSTALVVKLLSDRFELHSRSGRQTMGVLLFQDLAVVPCLLLLPVLADPTTDFTRDLALALLEAAVVMAVLLWGGQRAMRRLYDSIARRHSEELFVLFTLWVVVTLSFATSAAGLSPALGAFVGGILISETIYRHQVEADIRAFRDIFLGLFFVSIGMLLDVGFVLRHVDSLLIAVALLIAGKGVVVLLLAFAWRSSLDIALRTAAHIAQAGEFGLVLIQLAYALDLIGTEAFQLSVPAMLISMFLAPFLIDLAARTAKRLAHGSWAHRSAIIEVLAQGGAELDGHVIVCGFGRTGQQIGQFLDAEDIPYLALEVDPQQIRQASSHGRKLYFGHPDRAEVLRAAGLERARALVIAFSNVATAERVVRLVRRSHPDLPVVVRAPDAAAVTQLKRAGATEVIPEVLEAGIMVAAETLAQLGVPLERTMARVRAVRAERYPSLRAFYDTAGESRPGTPRDSEFD